MAKAFEPIVPVALSMAYDEWHYAPAVRVGDQIHVSGVIGYRADGSVPDLFLEQVSNAFDLLELILTEAGVGLDAIFSITSYHVGDMAAQLPQIIAIQAERLGQPHPAWPAIGVSALALPGAQVEICAIATAKR